MAQDSGELTRYLELTPKSRAMWQEATEYLPGGDSRHSIFWEPYPIFLTAGSGCHVEDADGVDLQQGERSAQKCYPSVLLHYQPAYALSPLARRSVPVPRFDGPLSVRRGEGAGR